MAEAEIPAAPSEPVSPGRVYRHRLPTRIWHWLNAGTLLVLLMSGPALALYYGTDDIPIDITTPPSPTIRTPGMRPVG